MKTSCPGVCLCNISLCKNLFPFSAITVSSLILWVISLPHCLYSLPLEEMDDFGSILYALPFVSRFLTLWAFPLFSGRILQFKLYTNLLFICMCLWFFCYFQIYLIFFFLQVSECNLLSHLPEDISLLPRSWASLCRRLSWCLCMSPHS